MSTTSRALLMFALPLSAALLVGCPPDRDGTTSEDTGIDTGTSSCPGANPAGCTGDDDCPVGRVCRQDPDVCTPSSCQCNDGAWACTDDCSGTVCAPPRDAGGEPRDAQWGECTDPDPSGCDSDDDCSNGRVCRSSPDHCVPSSCECRGSGTWSCTTDCNGTTCLPPEPDVVDAAETSDGSEVGDVTDVSDTGADAVTCAGPDPSGCDDDADCSGDEVCRDDPDACTPSTCSCTENGWLCTRDCNGTVCMPSRDGGTRDTVSDTGDVASDTSDAGGCAEPAPSGCEDDGDCADGEVCRDDPDRCTPSTCRCSEGRWLCTDDCNGTVCMTQ